MGHPWIKHIQFTNQNSSWFKFLLLTKKRGQYQVSKTILLKVFLNTLLLYPKNAYSLLTYLLTVYIYIYVGITFTRIPFQCMKVRVYVYRELSRQKTFGSPSKQIAELKKKKTSLFFLNWPWNYLWICSYSVTGVGFIWVPTPTSWHISL